MQKDRYKLTQDILKKVAEIDEFKGEWQRITLLYPHDLEKLKKITTIESAGSSTRIEGSQMSDEDIEQFLQGLKIQRFKDRDKQEVQGYKELLDIVFDNFKDIVFSESAIKHFHKILLKYSEKDQRHLGEYKKHPNRVAAYDSKGNIAGIIFETTPPYLTSKETQEAVERTVVWFNGLDKHVLLIIAEFIVDFLSIHPFQDGNGRLSRILTNFLLLQQGYEFVQYASLEKVIENNKKLYYLALRISQKNRGKKEEDISEWINFFLDTLVFLTRRIKKRVQAKAEKLTVAQKQQIIIDYVTESKKITAKEVMKLLTITDRGARKFLQRMVEQGIVASAGGADQERYYTLP
ncbi:MAG: Fic family protein [Candidatus Jacksonbacteria bacterium]|nr:Fic family protein [Candidatus Jacksonbacteria bacterium]